MKLKEIRKKSGKSQVEIAKDLQISQQNICRYENQQIEPDINTLIKLADYFKTTVDYLIDHDVPYQINKYALTDTQLELIEMIQNLNEANCNLVKAYLIGLLTAEEEKQNIIKKFTKGEL